MTRLADQILEVPADLCRLAMHLSLAGVAACSQTLARKGTLSALPGPISGGLAGPMYSRAAFIHF